jgi:hypothetical protein
VALRVTRLEQIVERALPRYAISLRQPPSEDIREITPDTGPGEGDEDDAIGDGRLQGGSWHGISAIGSVSSGPIIEQVGSPLCAYVNAPPHAPPSAPEHDASPAFDIRD